MGLKTSINNPSVKAISSVVNNEEFSVVSIDVDSKKLLIAQSNNDFQTKSNHTAGGISWTGPCAVWYDGKQIN